MSVVSHLRGFVRVSGPALRDDGPPQMVWGVRNTRTGSVITQDGTCASVARSIDEAFNLVLAARYARMYSFKLKELR